MKTINVNPNQKPKIIQSRYSEFENFVMENYTLQINEISNQEVIIRNENKEEINVYDLVRELRLNSIPASKHLIDDLFKSSVIEKISPYKQFFESLPKYDSLQKSEIEKLCSYIISKDFKDGIDYKERTEQILKKWLVNAVAQVFDAVSNDVMLMFVSTGKQGIGKTYLARHLISPVGYIKTGQSYLKNMENLPEVSTLYPFIFYDDLKGLRLQTELDNFKTSITDINVEYRKYGKTYYKKRISSYIATADSDQLLFDTSGSRRFAIIELTKIDFKNYQKNVDFLRLWSEAFYYYKTNFESFKFNQDDFYSYENFNVKYFKSTSIQFWIDKIFEPANETEESILKLTATQILKELVKEGLPANVYQTTNPEKIGLALKKLNFEGKRLFTKETQNTDKYYFLKKRK